MLIADTIFCWHIEYHVVHLLQASYGKCNEGFMFTAGAPAGGYCAATCNRCPSGTSPAPAASNTASPSPQAGSPGSNVSPTPSPVATSAPSPGVATYVPSPVVTSIPSPSGSAASPAPYTSSPAASPALASPSPGSVCTDTAPSSLFTCTQQVILQYKTELAVDLSCLLACLQVQFLHFTTHVTLCFALWCKSSCLCVAHSPLTLPCRNQHMT